MVGVGGSSPLGRTNFPYLSLSQSDLSYFCMSTSSLSAMLRLLLFPVLGEFNDIQSLPYLC